jgi:hypothetical protein
VDEDPLSHVTPKQAVEGFIAFAAQRSKMLAHAPSGEADFLLKPSQIDMLVVKYIGNLTTHHYNALGGQLYIEGRGWVNHCFVCDQPEGSGNHF